MKSKSSGKTSLKITTPNEERREMWLPTEKSTISTLTLSLSREIANPTCQHGRRRCREFFPLLRKRVTERDFICTRSARTSHKDFITTSQSFVSQCADSASYTLKFQAEYGSGHLLMILPTQHSGRSPSADYSHHAKGIRKKGPPYTVRTTMTIPTLVTFQTSARQSFDASATAERVAATFHELQPIGGRKGVPVQKRSHSPQIDHLCSQVCIVVLSKAWLELEPGLLRSTAASITTARPSDARGLHHVSCPLPVQPTGKSHTHHIERHPKFHHSTADLQSVSCTLRDRDILTLCSWQHHNQLRR